MQLHKIVILLFTFFLFSCSQGEPNIESQILRTKVHQERTATYNEARNLYFGDLHIHTGWSFDAYVSNVRTTPDDAYRFGKGEAIPHVNGSMIRMKRPLDFMEVL